MVLHSARPQVGRWQNGDASVCSQNRKEVSLSGKKWFCTSQCQHHNSGRCVSLRCIFYSGAHCVKRNRNNISKRCFSKNLRHITKALRGTWADRWSDPGCLNNTPSEQWPLLDPFNPALMLVIIDFPSHVKGALSWPVPFTQACSV